MAKLEELKQKIIDTVHKTISEYSETKTNTSYIIQKENFQALKCSINNDLNVLFGNNKYKINYYLLYREFYKDYIVCIDILDNFEKINIFNMELTIKIKNKKIFYYNDVKDIELRQLLLNTEYESELTYFIKELGEYEAECTLNEDWLNFEESYKKPEQEYYKTLTDSEKIAFAKGHGYSYAMDYLYQPLKELFDYYDLDIVNSLFDKIEFKY